MTPSRVVAQRGWMIALVVLAGCSSGGESSPPPPDPGILGSTHATYVEAAEATNSAKSGAEHTGYALDANGLAIEGSFEASGTTEDHYVFGSGPYRTMDVVVIVDGRRLNATGDGLSCVYDAVANDGYSFMDGCWSINMWAGASSNTDFYLSLYPDAALAGKAYTVELKGNSLR